MVGNVVRHIISGYYYLVVDMVTFPKDDNVYCYCKPFDKSKPSHYYIAEVLEHIDL